MEFSNCTHGAVRLAGAEAENRGRIEVCYNHVWGTVCDNFWSFVEANVVCSQLGFQRQGVYFTHKYMLPTSYNNYNNIIILQELYPFTEFTLGRAADQFFLVM